MSDDINQINSSSTSSEGNLDCARLKSEVLPALFRDPSFIGQYGGDESNADAINDLSNLMESGSVSALASKIGEIVSKLADADPQRIVQKPTWFDRMVGREVERHVRYQVARKTLDDLLGEAASLAQCVSDILKTLDGLLATHETEANHLRVYIQAGREFLEENPQAGATSSDALEFDRPRERLARRLANLATLLTSHEMSVTQMKLTRAQAMDMLDRFNETSRVLMPVWRQHTLALITTKSMNPEMVGNATKAHQALMRSLSKSLEGIASTH